MKKNRHLPLKVTPQAASIQVTSIACSSSYTASFAAVGEWSRSAVGTGSPRCEPGSGSAYGGIDGVRSSSRARSKGIKNSEPGGADVSQQETSGVTAFSTYSFTIRAPEGTTGKVRFSLSALFQGRYDIGATQDADGGAASAAALLGANMYVGSISGQTGIEPSFIVRSTRTETDVLESDDLSETLSRSVLLNPNTPFDVRLASVTFASTLSSLQRTGTRATGRSDAFASLTFANASIFDPDGGSLGTSYCIDAPGTSLDTCAGPTDPTPVIPLPAAGWLLLGGLGGLGFFGRRRRD